MSVVQQSLEIQLPLADRLTRRVAPAWLMSLVLHLAALLIGTLLVRGSQGLPGQSGETARTATIVLAHTSASKTEYFQENDLSETAAASSPANAATASGGGEPLTSAAPPASSIKLPDIPGAVFSGTDLVITPPSAATGRGGRPSRFSRLDEGAIMAEEGARPRGGGPTGPTAKVSVFGSADAEGRSFVFVMDRSQSMGGDGLGAITAAAKELQTALARLKEEHKFQVIAYNQKPLYMTKRELVPASDANKKELLKFLGNLPAFGATEHEVGLNAALRLKPDVIFLFTDGGDPLLNEAQLRDLRKEAKQQGCTIHCLHFGTGPLTDDNHFLKRLAQQTGGSYVYIDMNGR